MQRSATDDWPGFATSQAPSKLAEASNALSDEDTNVLVEDSGNIDAVLREHEIAPSALATDGAGDRLRQLTGSGLQYEKS